MDRPKLISGALFAGGGGLEKGLEEWCRPGLYIERNPASIAVLRTRMSAGDLPEAPVWSDIKTFDGRPWAGSLDILTAGFPCQDTSLAGSVQENNVWRVIE